MSNFRRRLMQSIKKNTYTELEYIKSTGIQYIDTQYKPSNNTRIIAKVQATNFATTFFFGARTSTTSKIFAGLLEYFGGMGCYYRLDYYVKVNRVVLIPSLDNEKHVFEINKGKLYFDDVNYENTYETSPFQGDYNLALFGCNTANTITKSGCIIYSCKIYDNDILVRDFIPVLDKNGIACMYDKVNKQYYYNAGTGEFLYG